MHNRAFPGHAKTNMAIRLACVCLLAHGIAFLRKSDPITAFVRRFRGNLCNRRSIGPR